ncbi:MAG: glycerol-3-phosphate cytidylyltransferase [Defluviitaleaceae bacterium]|nr:glycerol-3-phosphate cytidylyltransferase [Defluviitaleaceae bacterium]
MKRIITYGTFDLLHYGHIYLLSRAKALGDYLIVVLSEDEFNEKEKYKRTYFNYNERKKLLEAVRHVDLIIPEKCWEQKITDIQLYQADVFVMGDDWEGKFDYLKPYCEVVYLPRTETISTTQIISDISNGGYGRCIQFPS